MMIYQIVALSELS